MERNQRKIVGKDGVERIFTFPPLNVRQALKAEHLWSGFLMQYSTLSFNEQAWETCVYPLAQILLTGLVITGTTNEGSVYRIDDLETAEFFKCNLRGLLDAVRAGAIVAGFTKPTEEEERDSEVGQEEKTISKTLNP